MLSRLLAAATMLTVVGSPAPSLDVSFEPPVAVMHSTPNCPSAPAGKFDNRQTHAWFPTTHGRSGHADDMFVQIHQDVPGSGCPTMPCNCSVVYKTTDHGRSWFQTRFEAGSKPSRPGLGPTEQPLVAPLLRKDGKIVSLWLVGNRLLLDPSDPTNRTLHSPNGVWRDTGDALVLESEATVQVAGTPIAPGPGGESSMDTPMVMYQVSELSAHNGGGHLVSAYGFATNASAIEGCKGEAQDEQP
eukprot:COSAG06_NODE_19950_length_816_cov_1.715481_1_plen_243_part_10